MGGFMHLHQALGPPLGPDREGQEGRAAPTCVRGVTDGCAERPPRCNVDASPEARTLPADDCRRVKAAKAPCSRVMLSTARH